MDDDLHLIVEVVDNYYYKTEWYLCVPHGMNTFQDWKFFGEEEVLLKYSELMEGALDGENIIAVKEINGRIHNV